MLAACLLSLLFPAAAQQTSTPGGAASKPAPPAKESEADLAWRALVKSSRPPSPPVEWNTTRPGDEEIRKFNESVKDFGEKAAERYRDFYTKYSTSTNAADAKKQEFEILRFLVSNGRTNMLPRLARLEQERLKDGSLSEEERFALRAQSVERSAVAKSSEGGHAVMAELEKGARELQKEFPKRAEPYDLLSVVARKSRSEKAVKIAREIIDSTVAEPPAKAAAKDLIDRNAELVGKPLAIKFNAVDNREVDVAKLKGKVVLVDFWATWCGPCLQELPNVKKAYEKLHPKGFEIVGISLDEDKDTLSRFLVKEKMTWPQYFDPKAFKNPFCEKYKIEGIPTMWLVDKKGNVRDLGAMDNLEELVGKLLAE